MFFLDPDDFKSLNDSFGHTAGDAFLIKVAARIGSTVRESDLAARIGGGDRYFIGSEYFADEYLKAKGKRKHRYDAGVLFDLFAGKGADLRVEVNSFEAAKPLGDQI